MIPRSGPWVAFVAGALVVAGAMAWITHSLLDLEDAQREARADAAHQETLRLALWRMDSWLGPAIAAEAATPGTPATRLFRSVYEIAANGTVRASRGGTAADDVLVRSLDIAAERRRIAAEETRVNELVCVANNDVGNVLDQNTKEYASRARSQMWAQNGGNFNLPNAAGTLTGSGPLVASWLGSDRGAHELVFVRRAETLVGSTPGRDVYADQGAVQAFVADWPAIQRGLAEQVADVLPAATLRPILAAPKDVERGFVLASLPAALEAPRPLVAAESGVTPTRVTLGVAWTALALSFVAIGVTLRRTSDLSERRSRFASSVTHELRTPLTTFRLYSEMLADGMVADPAHRQAYLETLKSESSRLAHLVENVLAYSRVEEGRLPVRRERIAVGDLLLRIAPPLDRRATEAGATLRIAAGPATAVLVDVDPDVVGQIVFNLVDNAAKYAAGAADRTIDVSATTADDRVRVVVRDHGPGIDAAKVRAAFTPFERAGRPAGDTVPGIGLGLALSRALARDLGGDLEYEPAPGGGAAFALTLPTA